jgi:hypothetical protein
MALTTVVVNGNIHLPDGAVPDSATLEFRLVGNGFDMTSNEVIPQSFIADDLNVSTGAFTANLWPNDRGSLATYYQCILTFTGSSRGKKFSIQLGDFQVPEAGAPHEFATLRTNGVVSANSVIVSQLTQAQYDTVAGTVVNAEAVEAAAGVAEAARDGAVAASIASGTYVDTTLAGAIAAGLAGTSDTETFFATGADVDYIGLYLHDGGSEREYTTARLPKPSFVENYTSRKDLLSYRTTPLTHDGSGKHGIIYVTVGQSLSVPRDYSSGVDKVTWTSPHALMVSGGYYRNAFSGVSTNVTAFNAPASTYASLTQFVPSSTQAAKCEGFAMMADCPTVVGSYAIGARDYTDLRKGGSSLFVDFSMFLSQSVALLRSEYDCTDIDVVVSFAHGEAETDYVASGGGAGTPTSKSAYQGYMREWVYDITQTVRLAMNDLTCRPHFIWHQMGGVFHDDWRAIMEAQAEFADLYPNVHLAGPTTPYGFETDRVHPQGEAQALMGEWDWHLYQRIRAGLPTCLRARHFRRSGAVITVPHEYVEGPVQVDVTGDNPNMTDASGFNSSGAKCIYGVEVVVDGATVDIASVAVSGVSTVITLSADPTGATEILVRFGMMTTPTGNGGVPATTSRNNIRSAWDGVPSRYLTDYTHQIWQLNETVEGAV